MNQDFRVSVGFLTHRKTIALQRQLKHSGVVGLISLWSHTAAHNWSGDLSGYTADDIARVAGWKGKPAKFVDALIECGFLDVLSEGGYRIHDWSIWNDYATKADERVAKARKAAYIRHNGVDSDHASSNAVSSVQAGYPLPPETPEITTRYKKATGGKV
jgi:hypothetical protein